MSSRLRANAARPSSRPAEACWTIKDSRELYRVDSWGRGFFSINPRGHIEVAPEVVGSGGLDLKRLVDEIVERGIDPPLLIRFSDVLKARLAEIQSAFANAIAAHGYQAAYRPVYPIKVNQNRFLVEELVAAGRPFHYGLEAGSKPELLAVMSLLDNPEALVICNGYKDEQYIEAALLASRLGPRVILVLEKPAELPLILQVAQRTGVAPRLGLRARLATRGSGHWQASAGARSKFGLGAREMVEAVALLRRRGLLDRLELLHFHLGSQVSSIRNLKEAWREAARVYVQLIRLGAPLGYFDVGGGLGVDYDGSRSSAGSSIDYSLQEYANGVIFGIQEICDAEGVPHPVVVSEAGRATVAHHAVLVLEVLDVRQPRRVEIPSAPPADAEPPLVHLLQAFHGLNATTCRQAYHDALQYRDECLSLFNLGHLSLEERVLAEDIFEALCRRVWQLQRAACAAPAGELEVLGRRLADIYFTNFSLFQSLPDTWAIDQLFPLMPIHRLDEFPSRRGVLADITCDSDGVVDCFIGPPGGQPELELHSLDQQPYYLGAFLVGAYQEILGDLHNLFGDTHAVHASLDQDGGYRIEHVVPGDTISEVLAYVEYDDRQLLRQLRRNIEGALEAGRMNRSQARQLIDLYCQGLEGYTYLQR